MTREGRQDLENSLDQVGRGDATPVEATLAIRSGLTSEPPLAGRVYAALRDVTWRTLTARAFGSELQLWFDVFRHASALASKYAPEIADKVRAYADLISQSARFAELQPLKEVLSRKHSTDVLRILALAGKPVKRAALANQLPLSDSNLSRVIGALSGQGLIERSASGKEANFALTDLGCQTVKALEFGTHDQTADAGAWWHQVPFAVAVWDDQGKAIGANALFHSLASTDPASALPPLEEWRIELSKLARDERGLPDEAWWVRMDENKWIHYAERLTREGHHVIVGHDISAHMGAVCELEKSVNAAAETEAKLRGELAVAERRLAAYRSANTQIRGEIVDVAARSTESVRNSINALTHGAKTHSVPDELRQVEERLSAMQVAMRDFMDFGDIAKSRTEVLDPRRIVKDAVRTANILNDPDITVKFGRVERVRGALSPIRNLLGQLLMIGPKHGGNIRRYLLYVDVKGSQLRLTFKPNDPSHSAHVSEGAHAGTSDTVESMGLGYCQILAESYGGTFGVTPPSEGLALVRLSFPIQKMHRAGSHGRPIVRHVK
jgi:hypothetical protein